jgi:hypothetical protein
VNGDDDRPFSLPIYPGEGPALWYIDSTSTPTVRRIDLDEFDHSTMPSRERALAVALLRHALARLTHEAPPGLPTRD